jgi:MFS family permease
MSRQFLLALLAFLAFISLGLPDGLLGVSWPSISATFAIPLEALGLLVGVTTAAYPAGRYGSAERGPRLALELCDRRRRADAPCDRIRRYPPPVASRARAREWPRGPVARTRCSDAQYLAGGRIVFGTVADRVPLVRTLRLCLLGAAVGALLFWLEPTRLLSLVGLMAIGFSLAPVFASLISLTPSRVGSAHADSAIGFQIAAASLGAAALTGVTGALADAFGLEVIGLAILVFTLILLALHEGFTRDGSSESPRTIPAAP